MIITKDQFIAAWNKFLPSKMERFYYKHFSSTAENSKLSWLVAGVFFILFLMGYIGTIADWDYNFVKISTMLFGFLLVVFSIPWIYIWFKHNKRIENIIRELGCSMYEYEIALKTLGKYIK